MINNPNPGYFIPKSEYHPGYTLAEMATTFAVAWLKLVKEDKSLRGDISELANVYGLQQAVHMHALLQKRMLEENIEKEKQRQKMLSQLMQEKQTTAPALTDLKIIDELLTLTMTCNNIRPGALYAYSSVHEKAMNRLHRAYNSGEMQEITKSLADHFTALNNSTSPKD